MSTYYPLNLPSTSGIKIAVDLQTNRLYIKSAQTADYIPVYEKEYIIVRDEFPDNPVENVIYIKTSSDKLTAELKIYTEGTWISLTADTAEVINESSLSDLPTASAVSAFIEQKINNLLDKSIIIENDIITVNNETVPTTQAVSTFVENKLNSIPENYLTDYYNKTEINSSLESKLNLSEFQSVSRFNKRIYYY